MQRPDLYPTILIGTLPECHITSKHAIVQYMILLLNQDNASIKNNIRITCSTMNKFCRVPEHHMSITDSSISSFLFLVKRFYQFGATKLKPGRLSLEISVIQHSPQWSSRKNESFKRTAPAPFFSWGSSKESSGLPVTSATEETRPSH